MKKINLLVDGHFLTGTSQGTRTHIIGIYTSLIKNYGSYYNIFIAGHDKSKILKSLPIHDSNFIKYRFNNNYFRLLIDLPRIIKSYNIDFAHFQQVAPILKNCKFITTVHDLLFLSHPKLFPLSFRFSRNFLFRKSIMKSEIKLTVSNFSMRGLNKYYKIPKSEIGITRNGVASKFFESHCKELIRSEIYQKYSLNKFILFVSRFEKRKNHLSLLKAYNELKLNQRGIDLVFIGKKALKTSEYDRYLKQVHKDVSGNFHHFEFIDDDELLDFYRAASFFVYPSFAEGFGIPPLEAAAAGCPVLCSNQTAMSDFYNLEIRMFDPYKLDSLKIELIRLVNNSNLNAIESKKLIKNNYNWKNSSTTLHKEIQKNNLII